LQAEKKQPRISSAPVTGRSVNYAANASDNLTVPGTELGPNRSKELIDFDAVRGGFVAPAYGN